ncbi:class F sortase [Ornithinimicrobium sp. Y1847]|uniref:class F sortase n=1 Tax=Ornithinimicrobium sp. Y1847 TaxID=3405419 RepID=UPI003B66EBA7
MVAGHVRADGVPDVFADLASTQVGERVRVEDEHGTELVYTVTEVRVADKDDVMVDPDVWGPAERSRLAIVTCDDSSVVEEGNHFAGNLIVEAELTGG